MLSAACLIGTVLLVSAMAASPELAVYALSFWHYLFYWWAYRYGAVQPALFRRDAIVMKSAALTLLGLSYLAQRWSWLSAIVVVAGFALNLSAALALGHTRSYYGWELGDLPHRRMRVFPYTVLPHPMLVGNIIAFGGTLLNPGFRRAWWPLAVVHVALNAALIVMESRVASKRQRRRSGDASIEGPRHLSTVGPRATAFVALAAAAGAFAAVAFDWRAGMAPVALLAAASAAHGVLRSGWYVPGAAGPLEINRCVPRRSYE
jgi:hypothetical protein